MSTEKTEDKSIRLDKWLKLSRLLKTRTLASKACEDGKVKVNNVRSKPSRLIKIGDEIKLKMRSQYHTFDVLDIVYKSISNKDAQNLYREHEVHIPEESKELYQLLQQWEVEDKRKYKGRPTKKERRNIDKFRDH